MIKITVKYTTYLSPAIYSEEIFSVYGNMIKTDEEDWIYTEK